MDARARRQPAGTARRRATAIAGVGLTVGALLVAAEIGYEAGTGATAVESSSKPAGRSAADTAATGIEPRMPPVRNPLQQALIGLPPAERLGVLRLALRDAGFACETVVDAVALADAVASWRVGCAGARAFIVSVDDAGQIDVEPQIYHDEPYPVPLRQRSVSPPRGNEPFDRLR